MSRRDARRIAVEILYAADVRACDPERVLVERFADEPAMPAYAEHLVEHVARRRAEIDTVLARQSTNWSPERMSAVDRNVLRVALLELLEDETPPAVVIDEAVELAKTFSGEEAGRFVNGVLSGVLRARRASADGGQRPAGDA